MSRFLAPIYILLSLLFFELPAIIVAEPIKPPISLESLPRDQFPTHDWWQNGAWQDPAGWSEIDIKPYGLTPENEDFDNALILNRIFKETSGNSIVKLPAGTFWLRSPLTFSRDGLRLQGAGRDRTILRFAPEIKGHAITLAGKQSPLSDIKVKSAPKAGDRILLLETPSIISEGSCLWVSQNQPKSFGQIVKVASQNTSQITLDRAFSLDFDPAKPTEVHLITPRSNCGVENLTIDRGHGARDSTFSLAYASNIIFRGIESRYTEQAHFWLWKCQEIYIEENIIHHSRHYGVGGSGYGISLSAGTTRCLIRGNAMYQLRHALVFSNYSCFNVVADNYLRSDQGHRDERYHGEFPFANLFEGNDALVIAADSRSGLNGPWNTHFRNRVTKIEAGHENRNVKPPFVTIANLAETQATGTFAELNQVSGKLISGQLPEGSKLPPSLFRITRPVDALWQFFGPDLKDFGSGRSLPAEAWVPAPYKGGPETIISISRKSEAHSEPPTPAASDGASSPQSHPFFDDSTESKLTILTENPAIGFTALASLNSANDRIRVLAKNPGDDPVRLRIIYLDLPANFGGLLRANLWQSKTSFNSSSEWKSDAQLEITDFSPTAIPMGHVLILEPKSTLYAEITNNTKRLSRY